MSPVAGLVVEHADADWVRRLCGRGAREQQAREQTGHGTHGHRLPGGPGG